MEESGELGEAIGKYRALSGETTHMAPEQAIQRIAEELLDVAQTAVTMMFVLEEQHQVDIDSLVEQHIRKLVAKGYLATKSV